MQHVFSNTLIVIMHFAYDLNIEIVLVHINSSMYLYFS